MNNIQPVLDFFIAILKDELLLERFSAALESKDDQAILNLAQQQGYHFTAGQLQQGLAHVHNILPSYSKHSYPEYFERTPPIMSPIKAPPKVMAGLEAVRNSATTNMFDVLVVCAQAAALGYPETADWIKENIEVYQEGIHRGFELASLDDQI